MKKILILVIVLGGLVATAVIYQKQQDAAMNTATRRGTKSRTLLLPGLNIGEIRKIRIKDSQGEVNLNINADRNGAAIAERSGYAASLERINSALGDLHSLPIASKLQIGKSAWAKSKLQPPGEGAEGVGSQVELLGEGDKVVTSFILGDVISSAGGRTSPQMGGGSQRLVRMPEDGETVWVINNPLMDLEPKPEAWLDKAFFDVQKIKEVTAVPAKADEGWKVGRKEEQATDYVLLDAKAGEGLDTSKLPMTNLLANPVFSDVVAKDKVAELMKDAVKAKVVTFDGFTYTLQVAKVAKDGSDRYYLTVDVSADIPKTRPAVKDEKEEEKKKADEAFAAQNKPLEEKLAREKKLSGWGFEVSEYTVNVFFKKRSEIVQVEARAEDIPVVKPAPGGFPASPVQIPSMAVPPAAPAPAATAPVKAATPPVEVPAAPAPAAPQN